MLAQASRQPPGHAQPSSPPPSREGLLIQTLHLSTLAPLAGTDREMHFMGVSLHLSESRYLDLGAFLIEIIAKMDESVQN